MLILVIGNVYSQMDWNVPSSFRFAPRKNSGAGIFTLQVVFTVTCGTLVEEMLPP